MEFLQLISSEANDICNRQNKKVIVPDHILMALQKLGFEKYINDLKQVHEEHKRQEAAKPKISKRLEDSGMSREELFTKQQQLFQKAKSALNKQLEPEPETAPGASTTTTPRTTAPTPPASSFSPRTQLNISGGSHFFTPQFDNPPPVIEAGPTNPRPTRDDIFGITRKGIHDQTPFEFDQ